MMRCPVCREMRHPDDYDVVLGACDWCLEAGMLEALDRQTKRHREGVDGKAQEGRGGAHEHGQDPGHTD